MVRATQPKGSAAALADVSDTQASSSVAQPHAGTTMKPLPVVKAPGASDGVLSSASGSAATRVHALPVSAPSASTGDPATLVTAGAPVPTVLRVSVGGASAKASDVVLTVAPAIQVPSNQLFRIDTEPGANYLVETDRSFTNYRSFISSDYFEKQLVMDPERNLKRYGDGYAEQRLVNDQILALTGRRYLSGYTNTETEYKALMDAGVAFAQQYQLTPGVALTAAQMALLSTDIVWLSTQTVTLADGSQQQVLVPQVYLRRTQDGDLAPAGSLMAGSSVLLSTPGNLINSGSVTGDVISAQANNITNTGSVAGNSALLLKASNDLLNLSGTLVASSGTVSLQAGRDIVLQTRTLQTSAEVYTASGSSISTRTAVDRVATVQAGADLLINAGRDLNVAGAQISAATDLQAIAGRDITIQAVQGNYQIDVATLGGAQSKGRTGYLSQSTQTQQTSTLQAGGSLTAVAGQGASGLEEGAAPGTLSIVGSNLSAGQSLALQGGNVNIAAVLESQRVDYQTVQRSGYDRAAQSQQTLAGGNLQAGTGVTVVATQGDLSLQGASINTTAGAAILQASQGDVHIDALATQNSSQNESYHVSAGLLRSTTETRSATTSTTTQNASTVSGLITQVSAGQDITVNASNVVSDAGTTLVAERDVAILSGVNNQTTEQYSQKTSSGLLSGSGIGIMIGSRELTQTQDHAGDTAAASTVASVSGDVAIQAGRGYSQVGSVVSTPGGSIDIAAQSVSITEAREKSSSQQSTEFKQSGLSISVSAAGVGEGMAAANAVESANAVEDPRMKALASATAALKAMDAAQQVSAAAQKGYEQSISVSISVGSTQSSSKQEQQSDVGAASRVEAGGNVSIRAAGAGQESDVLIQGSQVQAGGNVTLAAEHNMELQAATDLSSQHSHNESSSASVGVALSVPSESKSFLSITASGSLSQGLQDGSAQSYQNTHISAGQQISLQSGADTTLSGAVVSAAQVQADVGGDLKIRSLQDSASFDSQQQSIGANASVGFGGGFGGSASFASSSVQADYLSVGEQSGIKAGDGGFQVQVQGNTALQGGVISASESANQSGLNSLSTGTLSVSDLDNRSSYSAQAVSVSVGTGVGSTSAGAYRSSGNDTSTTRAGISTAQVTFTQGDAASQAASEEALARTDRSVSDQSSGGGLQQNWNGQELAGQAQLSASIVQNFGAAASKAVGDYAQQKTKPVEDANRYEILKGLETAGTLGGSSAKELAAMEAAGMTPETAAATLANPELQQDYENWKEGGAYRVAAHAAVGAVNGGASGLGALQGAAGAGASAKEAPEIAIATDQLQQSLRNEGMSEGLAEDIAKLATTVAASALGQAVGGSAGAFTAANEDANNLKLHANQISTLRQLAKQQAGKAGLTEAQWFELLLERTCARQNCDAGLYDDKQYAQFKQLNDVGDRMNASMGQTLDTIIDNARLSNGEALLSYDLEARATDQAGYLSDELKAKNFPALGRAVDGATAAALLFASIGKETVLTLVDLAGKSEAIQRDQQEGKPGLPGQDYKPLSQLGKSLDTDGPGQTAERFVNGIKQIPERAESAAVNNDARGWATVVMESVILADAAWSAVRTPGTLASTAVRGYVDVGVDLSLRLDRATEGASVGNVGGVGATGRSFVTSDPGVGDIIAGIEARAPGAVKQAEINIYRPDGTTYTDFDIVTDTHVIQVKVGGGKGIVPQIQTSQQLTDLAVIGFDANGIVGTGLSFKPWVLKNAQQNGITIVNNLDDLMNILRPGGN